MSWQDAINSLPLLAFLVAVLVAGIKVAPKWEKVRLAELAVRKEEAQVRREEAASVGKLTLVFQNVTESTEELRIFLRAAMRQKEVDEERLTNLERTLSELQATLARQGAS